MYRRLGTDNLHVPAQEVYLWLHAGYWGLVDGRGRAAGTLGSTGDDDARAFGEGREAGDAVAGSIDLKALESGSACLRDLLRVDDGSAYYELELVPEPAGRIEGFFLDRDGGFMRALARRAGLRGGGFSPFARAGNVERTSENALFRGAEARSGLCVYDSGVVIAGLCQDVLGWASENFGRDKLYINSVALVEFTYETILFFMNEVLERVEGAGAARRWRWRVKMSGLDGPVSVALMFGWAKGVEARLGWHHDPPRTTGDFSTELCDESGLSAGAGAWRVLGEVYHRFGQPSEAIPFAKDDSIDEERLRAL